MFHVLKQTLKHSSVFSFANILQKGVGFLMIPVYTHYLTPAEYGMLEILDLSVMILGMLTAMGIGGAVVRFYHQYDDPESRETLFSTALFSVTMLSFLVVLLLEGLSRPIASIVLNSSEHFHYFEIIFISMGLQTIATIPESLLLAQKRSQTYSAITVGTFVSYLSLNILFIVAYQMGVMGMLLSMVITKVLNTVTLFIVVRHYINIKFSLSKLKDMLQFSLPLVPASFAMYCIHYSDRFFVQKYCGSSELGVYSLGYKFGMILSVVISEPIFRIWNTQRLEVAKMQNSSVVFGKMFTYIVCILIFGALGISIWVNEVVSIITPITYRGAAHVVALVVVSYVLYGIANYFNMGMVILCKTVHIATIQMVATAANILFNTLLIPRYGIMGAAVSTCLTFGILALLTFLISQHLFTINIEYRRVTQVAVLAMFFYSASFVIDASLMVSILLKSILFIGFPVSLLLIRFFDAEEIQAIRAFTRGLMLRAKFAHNGSA
jgi:O-antigen/teichoic acid export membrane protein